MARRRKDPLAQLLDAEGGDSAAWSAAELAAILDHQLQVTLGQEEGWFADRYGRSVQEVRGQMAEHRDASFAEVLLSPAPPLEALQFVKDFAKGVLADEPVMPADVARILYCLAALRGRALGHRGFTRLDDTDLERLARRCLTLAWMPDQVRTQFRSSLDAFQRAP